jgi:hypothetical protein
MSSISLSFAACIGVRYSVGLSSMFDRSAIRVALKEIVGKMNDLFSGHIPSPTSSGL